ncbi:ABC transporter substrate-binding protein [Bhargavaea ginsengi]|uniref:ABC transporter substrate-binding protein n=1 Tax=Bhargavaea ginsengi TaxID=426757 RepID=UPI003C72407D
MKKVLGLSLALLLLAAGCSNGNASEGEDGAVKIGALHPLSGGLANEGQEMRDAIRLAVEEVNAAGGIQSLDGAKVELIEADSEGIAEKGVSETQRLDREGVAGVVGAYTSGVTLPATQEAEKARIPFVVDIASADEVTERNFKYTFRLQPSSTAMAENFLDYIDFLNNELDEPIQTIALVHEDSVFGSSIAKIIKEQAPSKNLDVTTVLPHAASAADLSSTINKLKSSKPDAIIATTYLRDGTLLTEGLKEAGVTPKALIGVANGAFSNAKFITEETDLNQYVLDVNYSINTNSDLAKEAQDAYSEKFNKNLGPNGAYSYMSTKVLIDAIERAGSTDREEIRKALAETKMEEHILPQGTIEFDEKGQNVNAQAVLNQIMDGESHIVYPEEYKSADFAVPAQ